MTALERQVWASRAERLLEEALDELRSDVDAIETVGAAEAALRIACGELPPAELDGYPFPDEDEPPCTCPPDLVARGGYASSCPRCGAS